MVSVHHIGRKHKIRSIDHSHKHSPSGGIRTVQGADCSLVAVFIDSIPYTSVEQILGALWISASFPHVDCRDWRLNPFLISGQLHLFARLVVGRLVGASDGDRTPEAILLHLCFPLLLGFKKKIMFAFTAKHLAVVQKAHWNIFGHCKNIFTNLNVEKYAEEAHFLQGVFLHFLLELLFLLRNAFFQYYKSLWKVHLECLFLLCELLPACFLSMWYLKLVVLIFLHQLLHNFLHCARLLDFRCSFLCVIKLNIHFIETLNVELISLAKPPNFSLNLHQWPKMLL